METPFNFSVSTFVTNNINDTEDAENDFEDESNFHEDHENEEESELIFPTDSEASIIESDIEDIEADLTAVDSNPFLYDVVQDNDVVQNSVSADSDVDTNQDSIEQDNETEELDKDDTVEDYHECPICLSAWTNVGSHRLSALRCGHLFGYKCIKQWLKSNNESSKKCPQCNAKASLKHIRFIYANKLTSIDNSELELIKKQIHENKLIIKRISRALSKEKKKTRKYKEMYKSLKPQLLK